MDLQFGKRISQEARKLQQSGKDPNQIAKILYDQDSQGHNYGIGIVLNGDGQAMASSSTLLAYTETELAGSQAGTYMTSARLMDDVKQATLKWQRVPERYWGQFQLVLPSDAGTGAVRTGVDLALQLNPQIDTLGVEELGWPAYRAIARVARIGFKEFAPDSVIDGRNVLPIYQAGPMNTIGLVQSKDTIQARARRASEQGARVILDRAYPGFEFARLITTHTYDEIMRMSYAWQIESFIGHGVPFLLAISPTKAFITFALRPCGLLLVFNPDPSKAQEMTALLNTTIRARGSAFEHPISRAFAKALVNDLARLENEHQMALERLAEAEAMWRKLVAGMPIEYLYADNYAGLFRNPRAHDDAQAYIYGAHIYPVFANGRCRQNITGLPNDEALARSHVSVFAEQCY